MLKKLMTIRTLSILLSISLVLAAGLITGILSVTTGNEAVDDTKATGKRAVERTYEFGAAAIDSAFALGVESNQDLTKQLVRTALLFAKLNVRENLQKPMDWLNAVVQWMSGVDPADATDAAWQNEVMRPRLWADARILILKGATDVSFKTLLNGSFGGTRSIYYQEHEATIARGADEFHYIQAREGQVSADPDLAVCGWVGTPDENGAIEAGPCNRSAPLYTNGAKKEGRCESGCPPAFLRANPTTGPVGSVLTQMVTDPDEATWSRVFARGPGTIVHAKAYWSHPQYEAPSWASDALRQTRRVGNVEVKVDTIMVSKIIRETLHDLPPETRMYVYESPTGTTATHGTVGNDGSGGAESFSVVGTSHGEPYRPAPADSVVHAASAQLKALGLTPKATTHRVRGDAIIGEHQDYVNGWTPPTPVPPTPAPTPHPPTPQPDDPSCVDELNPAGVAQDHPDAPMGCKMGGLCDCQKDVIEGKGRACGTVHESPRGPPFDVDAKCAKTCGVCGRRARAVSAPAPAARGFAALAAPAQGYDELYEWADSSGVRWLWMKTVLVTQPGLQWDACMLLPREAVMGRIDRATATTRASIAEQRRETVAQADREDKATEDTKNDSFNTMYGIVGACVVILIILSIVFTLLITAPLKVLQKDMKQVAMMHLDNVTTVRADSRLQEVKSMQKSFTAMVKSMRELRNYMPQSVLDETEEADDEEEADGGAKASLVPSQQSQRSAASKSSVASRSRQQSSMASSASGTLQKFMKRHVAEGVKKKKVSMLVTNGVDVHGMWEGSSDKGMVQAHAEMVTQVLDVAARAKGVSEPFCGDRMMVSFNAVKPAGQHRTAAASSGMQSMTALREEAAAAKDKRVTLNCAVASGDAKCGNIGCDGMKRFTVIGACVTLAHALERWGRATVGAGIVADPAMMEELNNGFMSRMLRQVVFKKSGKKAGMVCQLMSAKSVGEDEWMYQLEEAEKNNPWACWDKCVTAVIGSDFDAAKVHSELLQNDGSPAYQWITQAAISGSPVSPDEIMYH